MTEWIELDDPKQGGCRPCCTAPHGKISIGASFFSTLAWIFAMVGVNSCHFLRPIDPGFLYCHPPTEPKPAYGSCGDCHCINGDKPCPTDPKKIPLTNVPDDWLRQLKRMKATNPYEMKCNPYNTTGALQKGTCTEPAQVEEQLELWEVAACGILYDMSSLDENQCPTEYSMTTYNSEQEMLEANAEMTHWGACGACSTTRDLAVYLEYPDLTGKGQECSVRAIANGFNEGVSCFQEVGYTEPCAVMWMHNVFWTRDHCFDTCFDFTFLGDGANNGPPPSCKLADCLNCDEKMSGPGFQTVAARSRRRSGLLSKIVRDCDNLLIVDHKPPCEVTQGKLRSLQGKQSSERPEQPQAYRPPAPTETCMYIDPSLGLGGYSQTEGSTLLSLVLGSQRYDSQYATCYRYNFNSVLSGFWQNQKKIFGSAYAAALLFGVIAVIIGGITTVFTWCSMCIVYHPNAWRRMAILYALASFCMFMTMVFFASGVCENGCIIEKAGVFSILSGFMWIFAAGLAFRSAPMDRSLQKSTCCCCPVPIARGESAYTAISARGKEGKAEDAHEEKALVDEEDDDDKQIH